MRFIALSICVVLLISFGFSAQGQQNKIHSLNKLYPGQSPPGLNPEIFAPGLIKNCPSFTPD